MRLLDNTVRPKRLGSPGGRMRNECITHHACRCVMIRMEILESTLRRTNAEVGGLKIMLNGVAPTTIREWLHLDEALEDGE